MSESNDNSEMESGAPAVPGAEVDEFAGIEPAPPRRSPILALSMIGLSCFTIFHLRNDIRYAMTPHQPVTLAELKSEGGNVSVGRYVSVSGIPGRRDSLLVESRGDKARESFFRLLDAEPPIFVRARDTNDRVELPATWKGRLQRLGSTGWASSLHDYFDKTPQKVARAIDLASLKTHGPLIDRRGRALSLPADAELEVIYKPSEYALYMSREKFPKKDDALHELNRVLALRPGTAAPTSSVKAGEDTPDSFVFFLPLEKDSAKQNELMALFEKAAQTSAPIDIELHARTQKMPLGALTISDWDAVSEVRVNETVVVDEDVLVLTEGEAPQGFLWAPLTAVVLLLFSLWNLWYLARPRRA